MTPPTHDQPVATLASRCVRALLDRHGVPRSKHSATVSEVLGLSYSQGNRRLTTDATWALEELRSLAEHFGETLTSLVAVDEGDGMELAVIAIGSRKVDCQVLRGEALRKPRDGALVATLVDSHWLVTLADSELLTLAYAVRRVVITPSATVRRGIAVLDDHQDTADSIVTFLRQQGFDAVAFTSPEQLAAVAETDAFDGYVLEWVVGTGAVRSLLASIRARNPHCPIAVLTGHGLDREEDIAAAKAEFRFDYFDKPLRLSIIAANFSRAFSVR